MPSERGRDALAGILENALAAQDFIAGMDLAAFQADRRTFYAVTRCLEIISEASRRVDDDLRVDYAHIPWRQIADAGNVYRHRYKSVTVEMVWLVARDRMPDLVAMCRAELESDGPRP